MPFDPAAWLVVADICCSEIPTVDRQALLRTALGRAYYAPFLVLRLRVERAQGAGAVPRQSPHEALLQAMRTAGDDFKPILLLMKRLRELRNDADYDPEAGPFDRAEVMMVVSRSRFLIRNLLPRMTDAEFRRLRVPR